MDEISQRITAALAGRYELMHLAGQGGMSLVFRARRADGGGDVALKVIRPELSSRLAEARFLREAEISQELSHPGIVPVLDSGVADGLLFLVMPFVEGETLAERLDREGALSLDESVRITREAGAALAHAHANGFIHRDVKPGNIMMGPDGALLTDFGIARALVSAGGERLTISGVSIGTPRYMSPEQGAGDLRVDHRTDEYSLACVLYEMLVGEPPFTGPTAKAVIARHIAEPPPAIDVVRPGLPDGVVWAVGKALSKNAADRFPTMPDFVEALAKPRPALAGKNRVLGLAGIALAVAAIAVLILLVVLPPGSPDLDMARILVFPPGDAAGENGLNDDVATYIGYSLEGTDPLRWEEARDWMAPEAINAEMSLADRLAVARRAGAGYFIDGSVLRGPDSVTVVLRLFDVRSGELTERAGESGPPDRGEAGLGAIAIARLLDAIVEPGRPVDLGELDKRSPVAIVQFLQGEVAYRMMRFDAAIRHYRSAVASDSLFAIAAVKGAQAAVWIEDVESAAELAEVAIRNEALLPRKYRDFIHGVRHYHAGQADSALAVLERTTRAFPEWAEGRMAMAEVYYHLIPDRVGIDSLARAGFDAALRLDSLFSPPLYHLAEIAVRQGEVTAARDMLDRIEAMAGDSAISAQLELMVRCARDGPAAIDWSATVAADVRAVVDAAQAMSPAPALWPCVRAASDAVLDVGSSADAWGALLVLQSVLLADGRIDELRELLRSDRVSERRLPGTRLFLLDAIADPRLADDADRVYAELGTDFASINTATLWLMLEWASTSGRLDHVRAIAATLADSATSGARRAVLLSRIAEARLATMEGDDDRALDLLAGLQPDAPHQRMVWDLWEALAPERLLHARLLIARGSAQEGLTILREAGSHRAIVEVLFLPMRNRLLLDARQPDDV